MEYDEQALEACTHDQHLRLEMAYTSFTVISVYPFSQPFFFQFFVQLLGWMESVFLVVFWVFFLAFTELYAGGHLQDLAVAPSGKMSPNFARMGIARSENRDALPYPTLQLDENSLLTFFWSPIFFLDSPASSLLAWIYIYTYI